jgi:hypothetical protein
MKNRSPRWWNVPAVAALMSDALIADAMSAWVPSPITAAATAPPKAIVLSACVPPSAAASLLRRIPANHTNEMQPIMKSQLPRMIGFLLPCTQASTCASVALSERWLVEA